MGRNWTRRSIEELVEGYLKKHGGGAGGAVVLPGGLNEPSGGSSGSFKPRIYISGYDANKLIDYGQLSPGHTVPESRLQSLNACCFIDIEPSYSPGGGAWPAQLTHNLPTPVSQQTFLWQQTNSTRDTSSVYGVESGFSPFWDAYVNYDIAYYNDFESNYPCIEAFYNLLKGTNNDRSISLDYNDFSGVDDSFGTAGIYVCLFHPGGSGRNRTIDLVWAKLANDDALPVLFDNLQHIDLTTNKAYSGSASTAQYYAVPYDVTWYARMNTLLANMMTRYYSAWGTSYAALWRIVLPHGSILPDSQFDFPYRDRSAGSTHVTYTTDKIVMSTT